MLTKGHHARKETQLIRQGSIKIKVDVNSVHAYAPTLYCAQLFATPWNVACQAPLPRGSSRQEYWSGLPFPPPGDLPDPGIEPKSPVSPASPALAGSFSTTEPTGKPVTSMAFPLKGLLISKWKLQHESHLHHTTLWKTESTLQVL